MVDEHKGLENKLNETIFGLISKAYATYIADTKSSTVPTKPTTSGGVPHVVDPELSKELGDLTQAGV